MNEDFQYLDDDKLDDGFSSFDSRTVKIPFMKVVQNGSPVVTKSSPLYIESAEEGHFYIEPEPETMEEVLINPLEFRRLYPMWRPNRGGYAGTVTPEEAQRLTISQEFGKWETKEGLLLQESYVYAITLPERPDLGVVILEFHSSGINDAKRWNRKTSTCFRADGKRLALHHQLWRLSTSPRQNDFGSWMGVDSRFESHIDPEQLKIAASYKANRSMLAIEDKGNDFYHEQETEQQPKTEEAERQEVVF